MGEGKEIKGKKGERNSKTSIHLYKILFNTDIQIRICCICVNIQIYSFASFVRIKISMKAVSS